MLTWCGGRKCVRHTGKFEGIWPFTAMTVEKEWIGLLQSQCELEIPKTVPFWDSTSGKCENNVTSGRWTFASDIFYSCGQCKWGSVTSRRWERYLIFQHLLTSVFQNGCEVSVICFRRICPLCSCCLGVDLELSCFPFEKDGPWAWISWPVCLYCWTWSNNQYQCGVLPGQLLWLLQSTLLDPGLLGGTSLSNTHFATFTWDCIHAWWLYTQVIFGGIGYAGDFPRW